MCSRTKNALQNAGQGYVSSNTYSLPHSPRGYCSYCLVTFTLPARLCDFSFLPVQNLSTK